MPALKIGVELASLRLPFMKALHTAAALGADGVEIDARGEIAPPLSRTAVRQVHKMLDDRRLRVASVAFRTRRGYDTPDDLEPRIAATKAAMELAYQLGAGVVVNRVGRVPADRESSAWRQLVDVLGELGRHGARVGALLAAETGTESGEDLARLLAELPEGTLGVDLNPAALVANGFSPIEAAAVLGPRILHVHATDAVGASATRRAMPASPDAGAADYPALLATLDEHGYRGYFTVTSYGGGDPAKSIAEAIEYFRGV